MLLLARDAVQSPRSSSRPCITLLRILINSNALQPIGGSLHWLG